MSLEHVVSRLFEDLLQRLIEFCAAHVCIKAFHLHVSIVKIIIITLNAMREHEFMVRTKADDVEGASIRNTMDEELASRLQ